MRTPFNELQHDLFGIISAAVYTTMTTVDSKGRPRSRVLIAVWEVTDGRPVGWLATDKSPVKAAHLAANPHAAFSYSTHPSSAPTVDFAAVDTVARWTDDVAAKHTVWEMYRRGAPRGVGYNLGTFWNSPTDPTLHVLRLEPWRAQVWPAADLAAGRPSRIWTAAEIRAGAGSAP